MTGCVLCGELDGVLWRSDRWRIVLNRNQNLLAKTMIVVGRHVERVDELTPGEWGELYDQLREVTRRLDAALAPDHYRVPMPARRLAPAERAELERLLAC